jgi:hypothetical protein
MLLATLCVAGMTCTIRIAAAELSALTAPPAQRGG